MEIEKEQPIIVIEPIKIPVPGREMPLIPLEPEPEPMPIEPAKVPVNV